MKYLKEKVAKMAENKNIKILKPKEFIELFNNKE